MQDALYRVASLPTRGATSLRLEGVRRSRPPPRIGLETVEGSGVQAKRFGMILALRRTATPHVFAGIRERELHAQLASQCTGRSLPIRGRS